MVIRPYKKFRPAKTDPGDGTFVEGAATQTDIYGTVVIHKGETQMIVSRHVDVLVADLLELDSGDYRVTQIERTSSAPRMRLLLERTRKPIRPATAKDSAP